MNDIERYYQILGLKPNASLQEVKQVYRNLVKIWHPDRFIDDPYSKQQAEEKIKIINQAYDAIQTYQNSFQSSVTNPKISIQKINAETYYQQGVSYAEKEEYQEAIAEFSQAIRLKSNYLQAYQYRGFILSKLGYEHRANADFRKAAELKLKHKTASYSSPESPNSSTNPQGKRQSRNTWQYFLLLLAQIAIFLLVVV